MCGLMAKDCTKMLELLKGDFEGNDDGIELALGLSIGGKNYSNKEIDDHVCNSNDKMLLEWGRSKNRTIHREMIEKEEVCEQKVGRKDGVCAFGNESNVNNQNLAIEFWGQNLGKRKLMKKNELQGEACRSSELEENNLSGKSSTNKNYKVLSSNGSLERCSSTISECRSSSPKGRSSIDNAEGTQPSTSGRKDPQFELLASTNVPTINKEHDQTVERKTQFGAQMDSSTYKSPEPGIYSTNQANAGPFSSPLKQQPPKPEIKNFGIPLLSRMPCVSTTGNGPNGKTVKGLLYRYNNRKDVSIICVCHGKSFSPAEFVVHAGGVDVTHPLRHITVIPPCS